MAVGPAAPRQREQPPGPLSSFFVRRELAPVASVRSCRALCGAFPRADTSAPGISRGPGLRLDFWVGVSAEILLLSGDFLKLQDFHF